MIVDMTPPGIIFIAKLATGIFMLRQILVCRCLYCTVIRILLCLLSYWPNSKCVIISSEQQQLKIVAFFLVTQQSLDLGHNKKKC